MNVALAYKYRSALDAAIFQRDLSSLREEYFYAPLRHDLNDPFEGVFDSAGVNNVLRILQGALAGGKDNVRLAFGAVDKAVHDLLSMVDKLGVFSLSTGPLNELLWAHYGGSHFGYCIEYDVECLRSWRANDWDFVRVSYAKSPPSIDFSRLVSGKSSQFVVQSMLGTKSNVWHYENEVRLLTHSSGCHSHDFRAIKSIYFGVRCLDQVKQEIMRALAGRGIGYYQIVVDDRTYGLHAKPVVDEYFSVAPYRQRIAYIDENALPINRDAKFSEYSAYLRAAAEVVCRDPYCTGVQCVDFSSSMSKPAAPVIFVTYQHEKLQYPVNKHLSIPEIRDGCKRLGLPIA